MASRTSTPKLGDRVIVRRLLPDTPGHLTDVIGHVVALEPLTIRPQSVGGLHSQAQTVTIPAELIQVVKVLPPRTVRNSEIRAVETAYAAAFPGIEHVWVEGWLLRAGDGITERSNSAAPLGASAGMSPIPLAAIREFYSRHELPAQILVPDRIAPNAQRLTEKEGWKQGPEIIVMTRQLTGLPEYAPPAGFEFRIDSQPSSGWLDLYHFRGEPLPVRALELLRSEIEGELGFGSIIAPSGETVAITRGTITSGADERTYLGYSAVEVAPAYRRRGLATALGYAMLTWGASFEADTAYLQVLSSNEAGIGLYDKMGFVEHHRQRYVTII